MPIHQDYFGMDFHRKRDAAELLAIFGIAVCGRCQNGKLKLFSLFHGKFQDIAISRINRYSLLQFCGPPAKQIEHKKIAVRKLREAITLIAKNMDL